MAGKWFPTAWQQVIYRNYGTVENARIAEVLGMKESDVTVHAQKLGIEKIEYNPDWATKGFVTVIRNNWDILTEWQIQILLGWTEAEYKKTLVEYDFLDVKLGAKPNVVAPVYAPLSAEQETRTQEIAEFTRANYRVPSVKPFDFFGNADDPVYFPPEKFAVDNRYTSAYCASFSGALLDDTLSDFSEDYLARLSATGINGVWIQETLRNLARFPFDERYSPDYAVRIRNLKKLTERCAKFGIGVYLYFNEPRSMPVSFFEKYPHLKGQPSEDGGFCLCTSVKEVQEYLYNAVKEVAQGAPLLKGVMTITMSENSTNCYSRLGYVFDEMLCPRCKDRAPEEVVAEVNNIMCRALRDGNGYTKLIANLWAWRATWTDEQVLRGIELLDKDVEVLCVSEFSKAFTRGGVSLEVIDYSISVVGPSEITRKSLKKARDCGHKVWAKIQVNNSWECSAVPYVPAFGLMLQHIENLKEIGVGGLMMGWSLGGYPGGALPLCNMACGEGKTDETAWYQATYGERSATAKAAVDAFDAAFTEYPFSVESIYFGGHNLGVGNLWSLERDGRSSTMVCFGFDDYETYVYPYGVDTYIRQYEKLTEKWKQGLSLLEKENGNANFEELKRCALACNAHFESARNLATLALAKRGGLDKAAVERCIDNEMQATKAVYELICADAKIGFEATNHYYYNENLLLEKLLNLTYLKKELQNF